MSSTTASTESANVPKAILYSWPTSVWSTVPQLCLHEKGYSEDEYIVKLVDIGKGENFSPSYLKINMNGTIPTLVVPTYETTAEDVDTRYRSLRDTVTICDFLDQARGMGTANQTVSEKPAPALAPATIEGKATSDQIITLVHRAPVDPNFVNVAARNEKELDSKRKGVPGQILRDRKSALDRFLAEAKKAAAAGGSHEAKAVNFLEEKLVANSSLLDIYEGNVDSARTNAFFETSQKTWTEQLSGVFAELEQLVKGPFCLGDQVSLADLHAISWLTRIVSIANANVDESAMDTVEAELGGKKIGPKVRGFWNAWLSRESFQKVLVPAAKVFVKTIGA